MAPISLARPVRRKLCNKNSCQLSNKSRAVNHCCQRVVHHVPATVTAASSVKTQPTPRYYATISCQANMLLHCRPKSLHINIPPLFPMGRKMAIIAAAGNGARSAALSPALAGDCPPTTALSAAPAAQLLTGKMAARLLKELQLLHAAGYSCSSCIACCFIQATQCQACQAGQ